MRDGFLIQLAPKIAFVVVTLMLALPLTAWLAKHMEEANFISRYISLFCLAFKISASTTYRSAEYCVERVAVRIHFTIPD